VTEAGALGAAILAGVGIGAYASVRDAARSLVRIEEQVVPDPGRHARYDELYAHFMELEQAVAPLYGKGMADRDQDQGIEGAR
jgi:sugar (pentulose or hexulose) kinase